MAKSGGQVGDTGVIFSASGTELAVRDTIKKAGDLHVHIGEVTRGGLKTGDAVELRVDGMRRRRLRANHSVTHLLHEALRRRLGEHVTQKGSLVAPDRLRFDFSHPRPVSAEDILAIEAEVNERIRANGAVRTRLLTPDRAVAEGALALFGEKYGDEVRVVAMGGAGDEDKPFSVELCGGTHVRRTGDIGLFKIVGETAIASGVRRIEALTGAAAEAFVAEEEGILHEAAAALRTSPAELPARIAGVVEERRRLERELADARRALAGGGNRKSVEKRIGEIAFDARVVDGVPGRELKSLADDLKRQIGSGVVAVVSRADGKAAIVVGVTADLTPRLDAVELVRRGAEALGGKGGGGRADMAQAGGPEAGLCRAGAGGDRACAGRQGGACRVNSAPDPAIRLTLRRSPGSNKVPHRYCLNHIFANFVRGCSCTTHNRVRGITCIVYSIMSRFPAEVAHKEEFFLRRVLILAASAAVSLTGCGTPPQHLDILSVDGRDGGGVVPSYDALMRIGAAARNRRRPRQCRRRLPACFGDRSAQDPAPLVAAGDVLLEMGSVNEAIVAYNNALLRGGDNLPALVGLTKAYLKSGKPALALEPVSRAYALSPDNPKVLLLLGVTKDLSGEHREAQAWYRQGLGLAPGDPALTVNLALSLALSGDYPGAIAVLQPVAIATARICAGTTDPGADLGSARQYSSRRRGSIGSISTTPRCSIIWPITPRCARYRPKHALGRYCRPAVRGPPEPGADPQPSATSGSRSPAARGAVGGTATAHSAMRHCGRR